MKISFVVPAYNEEKLVGNCVAAIRAAQEACRRPGLEAEIIVVDNNSSDATAGHARAAGARVVFEPVNQIARARNRGAEAASGEWLVWIDADSLLSPGLLEGVLERAEAGGHAGGGALMAMPDGPGWVQVWISAWNVISRLLLWAAGAFIWCRADAFRAIGGFNEALFASEEIDFSARLRRWARPRGLAFTILRHRPISTSSRKVRLYSKREMMTFLLRALRHPFKVARTRAHLDMWYDGRH